MSDDIGELHSTGVKVRIDAQHQGMRGDFIDRETAYATKSKTHLWIAVVAFKVTAESMLRGTDVPMDGENLMTVSFGCYLCEEVWDPKLARRACAGQPPGVLQYV